MNRIKSFWVKILTVAFTLGVLSIAPSVACSLVCSDFGKIYSCKNCVEDEDSGGIICGGKLVTCAKV